jgi:hypothetical protein
MMGDLFWSALEYANSWLTHSFRASWSALLIYGVFGLTSFALCHERTRWYIHIQRERSVIIFAIAHFFQGIAFTSASLVTAQNAVADFRFLLPWVRLAWLLTLVFFVWAVWLLRLKNNEILRNRKRGIVTWGEGGVP